MKPIEERKRLAAERESRRLETTRAWRRPEDPEARRARSRACYARRAGRIKLRRAACLEAAASGRLPDEVLRAWGAPVRGETF